MNCSIVFVIFRSFFLISCYFLLLLLFCFLMILWIMRLKTYLRGLQSVPIVAASMASHTGYLTIGLTFGPSIASHIGFIIAR